MTYGKNFGTYKGQLGDLYPSQTPYLCGFASFRNQVLNQESPKSPYKDAHRFKLSHLWTQILCYMSKNSMTYDG